MQIWARIDSILFHENVVQVRLTIHPSKRVLLSSFWHLCLPLPINLSSSPCLSLGTLDLQNIIRYILPISYAELSFFRVSLLGRSLRKRSTFYMTFKNRAAPIFSIYRYFDILNFAIISHFYMNIWKRKRINYVVLHPRTVKCATFFLELEIDHPEKEF